MGSKFQIQPTIPHLLLGNTSEAAGWELDGEEKLQFSALLNGRIYSNAGPQRLLLIRLNDFELECQGNTSLVFDLEVMFCHGSDDFPGSLLHCSSPTSDREQPLEGHYETVAHNVS